MEAPKKVDLIIIYSTSKCGYCQATVGKVERFLKDNDLGYVIKDKIPKFIEKIPAMTFWSNGDIHTLYGTGMLDLFKRILLTTP